MAANDPGRILNKLFGPPRDDTDRDARRVGAALFWALVLGLLFAISWQPKYWTAACIWASACAFVGMLLGFLFGIPRFLARFGTPATVPEANQPQGSAAPSGGGQPPQTQGPAAPGAWGQLAPQAGVNTNLEEISDWLTKIIVGVSLVELQRVQTKLLEAAGFIAQALGGSSQTSFAYGLLLYFSISGFLGGYLLTRLYLQRAFREAALQ
jgi:hypothetical protein